MEPLRSAALPGIREIIEPMGEFMFNLQYSIFASDARIVTGMR